MLVSPWSLYCLASCDHILARDGYGSQRTSCQEVLEADVKRSVGMRREDRPLLAGDVLGLSVLVSYGIADLCSGDAPPPVSTSVCLVESVRAWSSLKSTWPPLFPPRATQLTCMLTRMPSPLLPLTIAVTTTSVSLATKFRTHLSFLLSCDCDVAWRSNLRACAQATNSTRLQMYCSSDRGGAMMRGRYGRSGRLGGGSTSRGGAAGRGFAFLSLGGIREGGRRKWFRGDNAAQCTLNSTAGQAPFQGVLSWKPGVASAELGPIAARQQRPGRTPALWDGAD